MAQHAKDILFIFDDATPWKEDVSSLGKYFHYDITDWDQFEKKENLDYKVFVIKDDLNNSARILQIKKLRATAGEEAIFIFLIQKNGRSQRVSANSLGAVALIHVEADTSTILSNLIAEVSKHTVPRKSASELAADTCNLFSDTMDEMQSLIRSGDVLKRQPVDECCDAMVHSLANFGVEPLLAAIKEHHSFTYRHSMIVTLFTTALAMRYHMKTEDVNRLTTGALLHDVGKFVISPKILDKPSKLTDTEVSIMRRHPIDGAQLIRSSGEFDHEVVTIARHHHELLDGTGYPDGLSGRFIPDIVRLITIVDIFSALIETRSYKDAMSVEQAFQTLLSMDNKLDQDIVRAFQPIALESENDVLIMQLARKSVA